MGNKQLVPRKSSEPTLPTPDASRPEDSLDKLHFPSLFPSVVAPSSPVSAETSTTVYTTLTDVSYYKISPNEYYPKRRATIRKANLHRLLQQFPINCEISSVPEDERHHVPWAFAYLITKLVNFGAHALVFSARVVIYIKTELCELSSPANAVSYTTSFKEKLPTLFFTKPYVTAQLQDSAVAKLKSCHLANDSQDILLTPNDTKDLSEHSVKRFLTNVTVAVKIVDVGPGSLDVTAAGRYLLDRVSFEALILHQLCHPNIARLVQTFTVEPSCCVLIEEFLVGSVRRLLCYAGSQYQEFGPLPEWFIAHITTDIVEVLYYLHCQLAESTGVVCLHRDIKASNILVSHTARALLVDFGVASIVPASRPFVQSIVGTPLWMAPELIDESDRRRIGTSADIWSLGITILEMATTQVPRKWHDTSKKSSPCLNDGLYVIQIPGLLRHQDHYSTTFEPQSSGSKESKTVEHQSVGRPLGARRRAHIQVQQAFSADLKDFVSRCLRYDPVQRATAQELRSHPFLSKRSASRNRPSSYRALFIQLHKEATERFTRSPNTVIATKHHPSNPFAPQTPPSGCDEKEAVSDGKTRQWIAALQGIVSQPSNMPWRRPLGTSHNGPAAVVEEKGNTTRPPLPAALPSDHFNAPAAGIFSSATNSELPQTTASPVRSDVLGVASRLLKWWKTHEAFTKKKPSDVCPALVQPTLRCKATEHQTLKRCASSTDLVTTRLERHYGQALSEYSPRHISRRASWPSYKSLENVIKLPRQRSGELSESHQKLYASLQQCSDRRQQRKTIHISTRSCGSSEHTFSDGALSRAAESLVAGQDNASSVPHSKSKELLYQRNESVVPRATSSIDEENKSLPWNLLESRVHGLDYSSYHPL